MAGTIYYDYSQAEPLRSAASTLGVEVGQVYNCPRFFYPKEEGVEEIRRMLGALSVAEDKTKVLFFADSDVLNVSCQNALLKTLEDRNDVECYFVGNRKLLDTIESRCRIYRARIPNRKEFYAETGVKEDVYPWLYVFTKGHPDVAKEVVKDTKLCGILNQLKDYKGPGTMPKKELFSLFHMLKEKDPECFFEEYREYVPDIYGMIAAQLFKAVAASSSKRRYVLESLLGELIAHQRRVSASRSYSKNDFFEILARM